MSGRWDTPSVTLTHATVAVTRGGGSDAYDMDGGRRLWRTEATGNCDDFGAKEAVGPEKKTWTWLVLGIGSAAQKTSSTAQQQKQ